jgi:hypothetical protein
MQGIASRSEWLEIQLIIFNFLISDGTVPYLFVGSGSKSLLPDPDPIADTDPTPLRLHSFCDR